MAFTPRRLVIIASILISFTPATAQEVVLLGEPFDAVVQPALPEAWVKTGAGWSTSSVSPSSGSGANNLTHTGTQAGQVTTPAFDLTGVVSGHLRYWVRRTTSYDVGALTVRASVDDGASFPVQVVGTGEGLGAAASVYVLVQAVLPAELLGRSQVRLRFEAAGATSSSGTVKLDDVTVAGIRPLRLAPAQLTLNALPATSQQGTFTLFNDGATGQQVAAPVVSGTGFGVLPAEGVTIPAGGSQAYTVTFTPLLEGRRDGSVQVGFEGGALTITLVGTTLAGGFGFGAGESSFLEEATGLEVPVALTYAHAVGLQGLEFRLAWSDPALALTDVVRGAAITDAARWTLSYEAGPQSVKVILLGQGTAALPAAAYDPLLTFRFTSARIAPADAVDVTLTLTGLVGARALPDGADAALALTTGGHTLRLSRRKAFFSPSATTLDVGQATVGGAIAAAVTVANPNGTRPLTITSATASNPRFTLDPTTATVAPGASQVFVVTFTPTMTAFGRQAGWLSFLHDGEGNGGTALSLSGLGVGGRGDAEDDGAVDARDLIYGVDFVLGRLAPSARQRTATDLFPFPAGDAALDVRDLTVLAQALAAGRWPDAVALPPVTPPVTPPAGKAGDDVAVAAAWVMEANGAVLSLDVTLPVRAVQLVVASAGRPMPVSDPLRPTEAALWMGRDETAGEVRFLLARLDGGLIIPGRYLLGRLEGGGGEVRYATAIGAARGRLGVSVAAFPTSTLSETGLPTRFSLHPPYPSPYRARDGFLTIPVVLPGAAPVEWHVYDALGRVAHRWTTDVLPAGRSFVTWDVRSGAGASLAPGLYVLSATAHGVRGTRPVVVLP